MGSASDPLSERRGWTAEEIRSHWTWAPGSSFLNNSEFSLKLTPLVGKAASLLFGISLIASGLSSTVVGTMAGQVVMQGFVHFKIPM